MKKKLIQLLNKMILIVTLSFLGISYGVNCQTIEILTSCGAWAYTGNVECWDESGVEALARSISFTNSTYGEGNASGASSGWTGLLSADWNTGGNWYSGSVPTGIDDVTIDVVVTGNYPVISNANAVANSVTIVAGASLTMQNGYSLTISSGGSFINNGSFNAAASTGAVVFAGAGNISGATSFKNVTINGSVDFGTASTITGNLLLNTGGIASGASTHLVNYTISSLLTYNTTVTIGNEWYQGGSGTIIPGAGIPQSVSMQNGIVTIPNAGGSNRAVAGNLNINTGGVLQFATGTTRDLFIAGNWDNAGAFIANGRRVTFDASSGTQTLSGNTTFYDLTLNNSGATTDFGIFVITIDHEFRCTNGTMNGNTSTFVFTGIPSGGYMEGQRSKNFYNLQINPGAFISDLTSSAGDIHIANSLVNNGTFNQHASHTVYFDKTNATETFSGTGTTSFGKLVIGDNGFSFLTILNCTADFTITGGSIIFYKNSIYNGNNNTATFSTAAATVSGLGTANFYNAITNVALNLGSGISTINNNLQLNPGGSVITNHPFYNTGATLTYNRTTPTLNTSIEWTNNTGLTGTGAPFNVTVQNTNNVVITGDRRVPGTLNIATVANTLNINNYTLTVNSGVTGAGSLTGSQTSGLVLGGPTTALRFTAAGFNNYLKIFTINTSSSATLGNGLNIAASDGVLPNTFGTVTVNSGGVLNSTGKLTLKSDALGTAQVGASMGTINDEVTVERFYPSHAAWRFIGIPFSSSTQSINLAWQEGNTDVVLQCPPQYPGTPGYGTAITYNNTSGYDVHNNNYKTSMQVYQNNMWVTPASTYSNLVTTPGSPFPAYSLFVRGDRSVCLTYVAPSTATTLRPKGVLNQVGGAPVARNFPSGNANDYLLAGNPYASSVDIKSVMNSAFGIYPDKFWIWDPKLAGSKGYGSYVAFSLSGGIFTPDDPNYTAGTTIQSGQAFMVQRNSSGTASLSFKEADKSTYQDVNVFGLRATQLKSSPAAAVFINLVDTTMALLDGAGASLNNKFSAAIDSLDVAKLWNSESEKVALIRDGQPLAIELMPVPQNDDTLFVRLYLRQQPYKLKIYSRNLPAGLSKAWVADKYLGTQTAINLLDTTLYSFSPNADTNSYRNRFMLVFNPVKQDKPGKPARIDTLISRIKARIYPNPVTGKTFRLVLDNATAGNYTLGIYNTAGRLIATRTINYAYGQNTYNITVPAAITSGTYMVQIINDKGVAVGSLPLVIGW